MIVAMVAVRMVQVAIDQVVDVVAVRHGLMPTVRAVNVAGGMTRAGVLRRADVGMGRVNLQHMFVNRAVGFHMVQVPVVQEIDVALVLDGRVPAVLTVLMIVVIVNVAGVCHRNILSNRETLGDPPIFQKIVEDRTLSNRNHRRKTRISFAGRCFGGLHREGGSPLASPASSRYRT